MSSEQEATMAISAGTGALARVVAKLIALLGDDYDKLPVASRNDIVRKAKLIAALLVDDDDHDCRLPVVEPISRRSQVRSQLERVQNTLLPRMIDVARKDKFMEDLHQLSYDMDDDLELILEPGVDGNMFRKGTSPFDFVELTIKVKDVAEQFSNKWRPYLLEKPSPAVASRPSIHDGASLVHEDEGDDETTKLEGMNKHKEEIIKMLEQGADRSRDASRWFIATADRLTPKAATSHDTMKMVEETTVPCVQTICILGLAGGGKTTLAKLLYDHPTTQQQFQYRTFVSIPAGPSPNPYLEENLAHIFKEAGYYIANDKSANSLTDRKYLIVIDDIWHLEEWETITRFLPRNSPGSRIIVTTRINSVAEKCLADVDDSFVYEFGADSYTRGYGWSMKIVQKYASRRTPDSCRRNRWDYRPCLEIANKCYGMPLAVICMSSAFGEKIQGLHIDDDSERRSMRLVEEGILDIPSLKPLAKSLSLGYDHLPVYLKTVLLYSSWCSEFERGRLVQRWIAEGFVSQQKAEDWFDELVNRGWIIEKGRVVGEESTDDHRIHPVMLAFLRCKLKEQYNFVTCLGSDSPSPSSSSLPRNRIRRLFLKVRYPEKRFVSSMDVSRTHSLVVFGEGNDQILQIPFYDSERKKKEILPLNLFKSLRLLDLDGSCNVDDSDLQKMCEQLSPSLRYLGVKGSRISILPKEIKKLKHLEILYANYTSISELPPEIGELKRLRCLHMGNTKISKLPREIGELNHLQTLNVVNTHIQELPPDIAKLEHLEILYAKGTKISELPPEIGELKRLRSLNVGNTQISELPKEIGKLKHLQILDVSGTQVSKLPPQIEELKHLQTLRVENTKMSKLPLPHDRVMRAERSSSPRMMSSQCEAAIATAASAGTGVLAPVVVRLIALLGDDYDTLPEGIRNDVIRLARSIALLGDDYDGNLPRGIINRRSDVISQLERVRKTVLPRIWGAMENNDDAVCKDELMSELHKLSYDMDDAIDDLLESPKHVEGRFFSKRRLLLEQPSTPTAESCPPPFVHRGASLLGDDDDVRLMDKHKEEIIKLLEQGADRSSDASRWRVEETDRMIRKQVSATAAHDTKVEDETTVPCDQFHEIKTICILGLAGGGKTTLAKLLYDYATTQQQFQNRAFVSVPAGPSPNPNLKETLAHILAGAGRAGTAPQQNLIDNISAFPVDNKFLIVIDDIWHLEEWETIRKSFPKNSPGSRIIMTTRLHSVAEKCLADEGDAFVYEIGALDVSTAYAWSNGIVRKYARHRTLGVFREVGDDPCLSIAEKCCRMPLALIHMSLALGEKIRQLGSADNQEWRSLRLVEEGILDIPTLKPLAKSLSLAYDILPPYLRTVLIYSGVYYWRSEFERGPLVRRWIAEGFVSEQKAEGCFDELVNRGWIEKVKVVDLFKKKKVRVGEEDTKQYQIHPVMLAFLRCKQKEYNLITCLEQESDIDIAFASASLSSPTNWIRRLCLRTEFPVECFSRMDVSRTRSLVVLCRVTEIPLHLFERLRVLDLEGCWDMKDSDLQKMCEQLTCSRLRYLGLNGTGISMIPQEIRKLKHLETLYAEDTNISEVPPVIGELECLRTLHVRHTNISELPKEIGKMKRLDNLYVGNTNISELPKEIWELEQLRTLDVENTKINELPREISGLKQLQSLHVGNTRISEIPPEIGELNHLQTLDVGNTQVSVVPPQIGNLAHLQILNVKGTKIRKLPWQSRLMSESLRVIASDSSGDDDVKLPRGLCEIVDMGIQETPELSENRMGDLSIAIPTRLGPPLWTFKVAGLHTRIPDWIKPGHHVNALSSLDIKLYKLEDGDQKILAEMPNLRILVLRLEVPQRKPMVITKDEGFSKLVVFHVDSRVPRISFKKEAMPKLKHLEFKFYSGQPSNDPMGITNLVSLQKVVFRCSPWYKSNGPGIGATMVQEAKEHPNRITVLINDVEAEDIPIEARTSSQDIAGDTSGVDTRKIEEETQDRVTDRIDLLLPKINNYGNANNNYL